MESKNNWYLKKFNELSAIEMYNILRLRSSIFVIDQQCLFEEIDGKDPLGYHLFFKQDEQIISYCRLFPSGIVYNEPCISRVCTSLNHRGKGLGKQLMEQAIHSIQSLYPGNKIHIGAQKYLIPFYKSFGFTEIGTEYMEDGIPHREMLKEIF